jgi:hypothetical protein
MYTRKDSECTIRYRGNHIILSGSVDAVHMEAERILRRFAHSGRPYQVKSDRADCIVLAAAH